MKKLICLAALVSFAAPAVAGDTYVKGYVKKDGTYVAPHVRSAPNSSTYDNYSTKGNVNPYTGEKGTVDPYKAPTYPTYNTPSTKTPCYFNCK